MNFLNTLNPKGLQNYNQIISSSLALGSSGIVNTTEELDEIRNIIGLTNSAYDFGLQAALVCVNAYPEILNQIGENNLIGYIASYEKPKVTINTGKILPSDQYFSLTFKPYKIFKNINLTVEYFTQQKVRLKLDQDIWVVPYQNNNNFLVIDFPEELSSLRFGIQLPQSWQADQIITIGLVPNGYPFKEVIKNLTESQAFINVANRQGLLDSFLSIPELPYKIAIATLAVFKEQVTIL